MAQKKPAVRALRLARETVWAMGASHVRGLLQIADGTAGACVEGIQAIEARIGRPLDNARAVTMRGQVAVVPVHGPLFRRANMFTEISGATSLEVLATDIQAADDDPAASHILLDVDSPGGQVDGIVELAQHVRGLATPVTAYIGSLGGSAAYALAAGADSVVMASMGVAGSVGIVTTIRASPDGDDIEIVSAQSPDKRLDAATDDGREKIQALVDRMGQEFVTAVADLRGLSTEAVEAWRGGVKVGADAVAAGMADKLGTFEGVIATLQGEKMTASTQAVLTALTVASLTADHPAVVAELEARWAAEAEAKLKAATAAATATETGRVRAVLKTIDPEAEARMGELAAMLWDGATTGGSAAANVLAAVRAKTAALGDNLVGDIPDALPAPAGDPAGRTLAKPKKAGTPDEEWEANANGMRKEFGDDKAVFMAFKKAENLGQIATPNRRAQ